MSQEPPHKKRKQNPASTVYTNPDLANIITSCRRKNICPMVLKVKTRNVEGVQHAIILYDPPSQNTTTWDDGKIGTSDGCKLTDLLPTEQTQYVVSMLKLMLKAAETIDAERQCNGIHFIFSPDDDFMMAINIALYESTTFRVLMMVKHILYEFEGEITRNKDVVFSKRDDVSYIMDTFAKLCIGNFFEGTLQLVYDNVDNEDADTLEFDANMCIKKLMSPESSHPPLARDIPQEIRPPRQVRSLSPFRRIGIRPIPEEIMASIRARDHFTYWPARSNSPRPSFDEHL